MIHEFFYSKFLCMTRSGSWAFGTEIQQMVNLDFLKIIKQGVLSRSNGRLIIICL